MLVNTALLLLFIFFVAGCGLALLRRYEQNRRPVLQEAAVESDETRTG